MTALQELIEILNESQKFINDNDSKEDKYYRSGLREAIEEAKALLETEEEARDAYNVSQERMYSEEEVLKIIDLLFHKYASSFRIDAKEYFLQFKKK